SSPPCTFLVLFFSLFPPPPGSTLFPYTTLFRSRQAAGRRSAERSPAPCTQRRKSGMSRSSSRRGRTGSSSKTRGTSKDRCSAPRSEEHTSELQSRENLVCRLLLEKKKVSRKVLI